MKVTVNHSQIQGTDASVFENLQQTLEQFVNERQWTDLQFQKNERIQCNLNITVSKYVREENRFECSAIIQANRPVFNSAYTTTLYNNKDNDFHPGNPRLWALLTRYMQRCRISLPPIGEKLSRSSPMIR